MANTTGLGKGLSALFRETNTEREDEGFRVLPLKDIVPNKEQPRKTFHDKSLEELAESIRVHGLLQPIVVRALGDSMPGKYEVVAGERRYRACKLAELLEVPVMVKKMTNAETLTAALVENIQREDLNAIEEAIAIQTLKDAFNLSQEDLAARLGKSRSAVANSLRLLGLPIDLHKEILEGKLSAGHARAILSVQGEQAQLALYALISAERLSVRETEGVANRWKTTGCISWRDADSDATQTDTIHETPAVPTLLPERVPKVRRPQAAVILQVQERISSCLQAQVKVTGRESKGKITISYASKEELDALLEKLAASGLQGRI